MHIGGPTSVTAVDYANHGALRPSLSGTSCIGPSTSIETRPPPLVHRKSPYACIPLPVQLEMGITGSIMIHPTLMASGALNVSFDMKKSLETHLSALGRYAHEPATMPSLPSLTLIIPSTPWPITVHATVAIGGRAVVTVGDVISCLHHGLNLPAAECVARGGGLGLSGENSAWREPRALRRFEYLNHKTTFVGLSLGTTGSDILVAMFK